MWSALCGRPLTVESRKLPGLFTPGRSGTKSSEARLVSGRLTICVAFKVVETAEACDCTISVMPCTVMVSARAPTSSVTLTAAGTPAFATTSLSATVLKPASETVTV